MIKVRCDSYKGCKEHDCPHWDVHGFSKVTCKKHICTLTHRNVKCLFFK